MDTQAIKKESETIVSSFDGEICDWLPVYDISQMRSDSEIINRALIMNAMINIAFNAPIDFIKNYIDENQLAEHLSEVEKTILTQSQENISEQDKINLHWYLESLWALIWVMNKFDDLSFPYPIPDDMIDYCPDLQQDEGPEKFTKDIKIRSFEEIYKMRDVYYRAMWSCRHYQLNNDPHDNFNMSIIMERRRALSWCLDKQLDWDDVPQDT
ncbi:DUF4272 domain-containing protein [Pseudoalteromonas rhizosphaerae]|uniref:DUF4272 domain-containing protein n=1 Tax=Pseudoalteromonas rhizosphaerae TaxID=2518973 RepID=UPI0012310B44|nr:DUF4272 domain-containing protein [Pseudoalteromonas rhizosphaerae]